MRRRNAPSRHFWSPRKGRAATLVRDINLLNMTIEQRSTNVQVRATLSIADGIGSGTDTRVSLFRKAVCAREGADVSGGALGGGVIRISTMGTFVDLEKTR